VDLVNKQDDIAVGFLLISSMIDSHNQQQEEEEEVSILK